MNDRILAAGVVVLLVAGLTGLFFLSYTRESYQEFVPPLGEARHNPLLAAERLLADLGYAVESDVEFAPSLSLPDTDATIVLGFNYRWLDEDDLALLMAWVERGGHLIVEIMPRFGRLYDPIFTALGIEARSVPQEKATQDAPDPAADAVESLLEEPAADLSDDLVDDVPPVSDGAPAAHPPDPDRLAERFAGREYWGDMAHDNRRVIDFGDNEPVWSVADETGIFAGQIGYDAGLLTIVADLSFINNRRIAQRDHAYILTRLVGSAETAGNVWLYYGGRFPTLMSLLWQHADFLFKAGAVVLLLTLWWAGQRFGPRLDPPASARKAFLEHIAANGKFLWRHHQQDELLAKTQRAFLRDAQRRHTGARAADDARRNDYLAEVCDIARDKVDNALGPLRRRNSHEFIDKMQLLNLMWKRI